MNVLKKAAAFAALIGLAWFAFALPARADVRDYEFQLMQNDVKAGDGGIIAVRLTNKRTGRPVPDAVIFAKCVDMAPDGMPTMTAPIELLSSTHGATGHGRNYGLGCGEADGTDLGGTREQLSALYRLCLAEYLGSTVVLDDQLVQSDDNRMDWFRAMLAEKARTFQILVFTCRPGDYLAEGALVPTGSAIHADTDGGFVPAVDLGRALRRR